MMAPVLRLPVVTQIIIMIQDIIHLLSPILKVALILLEPMVKTGLKRSFSEYHLQV